MKRVFQTLAYYSPIWSSALSGVVAARFLNTYDGYLYLSSARALFSDEMVERYHWIREPFYPLFLKIVTSAAHSDLLLAIVQSLILGLAMFWLANVIGLGSISRLIASLGVFGSAVVVGINGAVLQQSLMASLLLLITASFLRLYEKIRCSADKLRVRDFLSFTFLQTLAVLTTFFFVFAIFIPSALLLIEVIRRGSWRISKLSQLVGIFAIPYVALLAWWGYKYTQIQFSRAPEGGFAAWPFQFNSAEIPVSNPVEKFFGLVGVFPDAVTSPESRESLAFAIRSVAARCGQLDDGPHPYSEYISGLISASCRNAGAASAMGATAVAANVAFAGILILGTVLAIVLLFIPKFGINRLGFLPALVLLLTYYLFALGISRYAIPMYPAYLMLILYSFEQAMRLSAKRKSREVIESSL